MTQFKHSLFGCFNNFGVCIISFIVPCYTVGKTAEAAGESCIVYGLGYILCYFVVGAVLRNKIRNQKDIEGTAAKDCLVHFFCPPCAVIQDHLEIAYIPIAAGLSMGRD